MVNPRRSSMLFIVVIMFSLTAAGESEDFSKRLTDSFDTTPVGKQNSKVEGGPNPAAINAAIANHEAAMERSRELQIHSQQQRKAYERSMQQNLRH